MRLNCQSINAKFNELQIIIEEINNNALSVICLQESLLIENNGFSLHNLHVANYKLFNLFSTECSDHGGLMTYIHNRFDVSPPIKILESVSGWEYVCVVVSQSIPILKNISLQISTDHLVKSLRLSQLF